MVVEEGDDLLILEEELIRLILEFLSSRDYHVSLRTLERESCVTNSDYSDEVLFLRELVLDGDFDEVLQFGASLKSNPTFDENKFNYIVLRQKFIELIYTKSHILGKQNINTVSDVMKTLSHLEKYCTTKAEYNNLCWLLTLPDLNSHEEFKNWNLDISRLDCFNELLNCLSLFMPLVKRNLGTTKTSSDNRLLKLIVKGLFYETCTDYCQSVAAESSLNGNISIKNNILDCSTENGFSSNLISWIRCLPPEVFQFPFEMYNVDVCYSKVNGKKTQYARNNINGTFDTKKEKPMLKKSVTRQSSEPDHRDVVKLSGIKSKSIDLSSPNILSSSFPTTDLRKGMRHNSNSNKYNDMCLLQSSYTAGSTGDSKNVERQFRDLSLHSPNVPPVLSSSAFDMSPVVGESNKVPEEKAALSHSSRSSVADNRIMRSSITNDSTMKFSISDDRDTIMMSSVNDNRLIRTSLDRSSSNDKIRKSLVIGDQIKSSFTDDRIMRSSVTDDRRVGNSSIPSDQLIEKKEDRVGYFEKPRNIENKNKHEEITPSKTTMSSNALQNQHQVEEQKKVIDLDLEANVELNLKTKKSAIAFELFDSKPTERVQVEQKRRDELFNKLKQHEESRQESLKSILSDVSPGSITSKPPTPSSVHSTTEKSFLSSNERLYSGNKKMNTQKDQSPPNYNGSKDNNHFKYDKNSTRKLNKTGSVDESQRELKHGNSLEHIAHNAWEDDSADKESNENSPSPNVNQRGPVINGVRRPPRAPIQVSNNTPSSPNERKENEEFYKSPLVSSKTKNLSERDVNTLSVKSSYEMKTYQDTTLAESNTRLPSNDVVAQYKAVSMLEDTQAIRSVCFHPSGQFHAIGANSKMLRICKTVTMATTAASKESVSMMPVVFKRPKYHRGSIYCMSWDPEGRFIATGSNDKTIKLLQFDTQSHTQVGDEIDFNIHAGTVRDLAFVPNRNGYLISGGAGTGSVNITDVNARKVVGTFDGHSGNILSVYVGNAGDLVTTGGTDNTVRLWDLRSQRCIDVIVVGESSPASISLSHANKYVASGQEDGSILLYDITAGRTLHNIRLHKSDCRSVRFSPDSNYLMTSSYDSTIALMHLRTNIEHNPPKHYIIAQHSDKVIQCRWHPSDNILLSSSADRTAILWRASDLL